MVLPFHLKRRPLTLAVCLAGLAPSSLWAAAEDWNCTRSKDDKQWVCATKSPGTKSTPAETPREVPEGRTRAEPPAEPMPPRRATARPVEPEEPEQPAPRVAQPEPPAPRPAQPPRAETPPAEPSEPPAPTRPSIVAPKSRPAPAIAAPTPLPTTAAELKRLPEAINPQPTAETKTAAKPQRSGWACEPGEADESGKGWNCSLTGADPRGVAHVVGESGQPVEKWAEATTITPADEQRFGKMMSLLPTDPWKNVCAPGLARRKPAPVAEYVLTNEDRLAREAAPTEIQSDYFEMLDSELVNFSGAAQLTKADQKLWGDFVTRNTRTNAVNAQGNVIYQEKGFSLSSDTGFLDSDTSQGVFRNSQFLLETIPARGTSRVTHLDSGTLSRYETFTYTTCPPGDQDWLLHADKVKINKETGTGTAQSAWIEFKDVPFFWTPYMSFPVDSRRLSGFLSPSASVTKYGGFAFAAPYYFNLAPNYDYTVMPRYLTKRGFQLNNEFRYLSDMTRGRIIADIVPDDQGAADDNAEIDAKNAANKAINPADRGLPHIPTVRGQAAFLNDTRFSENLIAHVDANYVSDYRFLNQFGSPLHLVDKRNIRSIGYLNYAGPNYALRGQIDYYQTIDPTVINANGQPYFHLPQLVFSYFNPIADTGLMFEGLVQADGFDTSAKDRTTGQRLKLRPRIYYPFQTPGGYITPSFAVQHNEYWLTNPDAWTGLQQAVWANSGGYTGKTGTSESMTVPIFSLDSGATFERDMALADTPMLQTLEPRLFYTYIPKVKQDNIPVFDSSPYDYTYYQLFRENRFTGGDRIGDSNQLTLALTSRLIDQSTGLERLRASIGNAFYFQNREVSLYGPPVASQLESNSNLIGDVFAGLSQDWSLRAGGQWNPDRNQIDRGIVALQYNNRQNDLLNVAYRYRRNQNSLTCVQGDLINPCLNLTDVSFRLPIVQGWHVIGRWQYSIVDRLTLETFLGFERETCCWRFSLLGRRFINNIQSGTGDTQANNGIFLQLEFKGLTRLGDQVDLFMRNEISGYRFGDYY
ncbi:LPS-assembly protein LptD [Methylomagnum sp.]